MENELVALSRQLVEVVERVNRAVVSVEARRRFSSSGVHWRPGVVVTAEHTIRRAEEIAVGLPDGRSVTATLSGRDPGTDLAVLKIDAQDLPVTVAAAAPSEAEPVFQPGQLALTVGRSPDTGVTATMGIISSVSGAWRSWRGGRIDRFVRLDLAAYPGTSGSAVVDAAGRVLGIATAGLSRISSVAIPATTVDRVVNDLLSKGHVARGYLGVGLHPVSLPDHLMKQAGISESSGLIVLSVENEGPAARAGILVG